jgi:hypothetical protein
MSEGNITERGKLLLRKPVGDTSADAPYYEAGGSTFHVHTCPTTPPHTWRCNSPYCNILSDLCPDHGGEEPVKIGREPWRR